MRLALFRPRLLAAALAAALMTAGQAAPQGAPGPRLDTLTELASVLGEAHAIRTLCNGDRDQTWRDYMMSMMDMEAPSGPRRSSLTSAFNRGYRVQSSQRSACTSDLVQVEAEIAARGRALSDAIAAAYLE